MPLPEFMRNRVVGQTSTIPFILEAAKKLRQDHSVSLDVSGASTQGVLTLYGTKTQLAQAVTAMNKRFVEWVCSIY